MASQTITQVIETEQQTTPDQQDGRNGSPQEAGNNKKKAWIKTKLGISDSKKPPSNKWLQQQIPACRPVFSAKHVFVAFVIIGIVFVALGIAFTIVSMRLRQFEVPYTNCGPLDSDEDSVTAWETCEEYLDSISGMSNFGRRNIPDCHCKINFTLPETMRSRWYLYYGMRNYYQNHRRYLNSWDVNQLRGDNFRNPSSDCRPIVNFNAGPNDTEELPVVPCGMIANSWFNDSFDVIEPTDSSETVIMNITRTNIAWNTDRTIRFQNPGNLPEVANTSLVGTVMPPNWVKDLSEIDGGLENETLMVWFRVSAFPWFRKLYGRPIVNGVEGGNLPSGNYSITITYNYPVDAFNGQKSIIFAEVSRLGGRNLFLGIAYLVVGALLIVIATVLLVVHLVCSKWKETNAPF